MSNSLIDHRLFNVKLSDHVLTYLGKHPIAVPYQFNAALGPYSISPYAVKLKQVENSTASEGTIWPVTSVSDADLLFGVVNNETPKQPVKPTRRVFLGNPLGQCTFRLPTEETLHFAHTVVPTINNRRTIPIVDIVARSFFSPVNLPLFEPVSIGQEGLLTFRYKGKYPLHTVMTGGLILNMRATDDHAYPLQYLMLNAISGLPSSEQGGSSGCKILATSGGGMAPEPFMVRKNAVLYNDRLAPPTPEDVAILKSDNLIYPNLFTGSENLRFTSATAAAIPEYRADGVVNSEAAHANHKTTAWFTCEGGEIYYLEPQPAASTTSVCRIQYRVAGSSTTYFKDYFKGSNGYIKLPHNAISCRIYYCNATDTVQTLGIYNRSVLGNVEAIDPLAGYWQKREFMVNTPITLYPNTVYAFQLATANNAGEAQLERVDGYRFESGGFNMLFDTTPYVEDMLDDQSVMEDQ